MANDFTDDANCIAVWRFVDGALGIDSKGSIDLSASGSPTADTINFKEGAASVDIDEGTNDTLFESDVNLPANFPGKNGQSAQTFSTTFWARLTSDDDGTVISKFNSSGNTRCWRVAIQLNAVHLVIGNGGASQETHTLSTSGMSLNTWYHVGATYNGSTKAWTLRLFHDDTKAVDSAGGTGSISFAGAVSAFAVGRCIDGSSSFYFNFDGQIDELTLFIDILTPSEINKIQAGTYGSFTELSGTIAGTSTVSGDIEVLTFSELSGTIAGQSVVGPASLGQTAVSLGESIAISRLVAVGNDRLYYEDI